MSANNDNHSNNGWSFSAVNNRKPSTPTEIAEIRAGKVVYHVTNPSNVPAAPLPDRWAMAIQQTFTNGQPLKDCVQIMQTAGVYYQNLEGKGAPKLQLSSDPLRAKQGETVIQEFARLENKAPGDIAKDVPKLGDIAACRQTLTALAVSQTLLVPPRENPKPHPNANPTSRVR